DTGYQSSRWLCSAPRPSVRCGKRFRVAQPFLPFFRFCSQRRRSAMANLMNTVKERATEQLDTQKSRATDGLSVIAGAVRQSTQQLRSDQHEVLAQYVDRAADQLERFSNAIRDKDIEELLRDARQFA